MSVVLFVAALFCCTVEGEAQGSMQFIATLAGTNEVPANSDPTVRMGTFSLNGNALSFYVDVPALTFISVSGYIQGPAPPGSNGPTIFDLGGLVFHGGSLQFGVPPSYVFFSPATGSGRGAGPFPLTDAQMNHLMSGLWYVNITSYGQPDGQLRGQIVGVPEPSIWASVGFGTVVFWCLKRKWSACRSSVSGTLFLTVAPAPRRGAD